MSDYYSEMQKEDRSSSYETPRAALKRVRAASCYGALRIVIGVIVAPGYILSILIAGAGAGLGGAAFAELEWALPAITYFAISGIVFVLTLALHQSMRLLADIADLLVEQVRGK